MPQRLGLPVVRHLPVLTFFLPLLPSFCRVVEGGIVHAEMRPLPLALLPLASLLSPETPDRLALIRACSHAGAPALKYQRIRNLIVNLFL